MMNKAIFILAVLLFVSSCNTTEPPKPPVENPYLEYTWTVDTLKNPNGYGVVPNSMWGTSPENVWMVGFNSFGEREVFHYDGTTWERQILNFPITYETSYVYGFAENDVYIAGYRLYIVDNTLRTESLILHYDGSAWRSEEIPIKRSALRYIHGNNPNNIWACGKYGSLYHKSGGIWERQNFNDSLNLGPIYVAPGGNVYMMSFPSKNPSRGDSASHCFWEYSNNQWKIIDSNYVYNDDYTLTRYTFGNEAMWGISENEIYSAGNAVYKFDGNKWSVKVWDDYPYRDFKGISRDKLFAVGYHGTIRYFNNQGWYIVPEYYRYIVDFYCVMPFEDEIFIGAYQLGVGYAVTGKLKN